MALSLQHYPRLLLHCRSLNTQGRVYGRKPLVTLDVTSNSPSVLKAKQYSLEGESSSLTALWALFQALLSIQEKHFVFCFYQ